MSEDNVFGVPCGLRVKVICDRVQGSRHLSEAAARARLSAALLAPLGGLRPLALRFSLHLRKKNQ